MNAAVLRADSDHDPLARLASNADKLDDSCCDLRHMLLKDVPNVGVWLC
jgi:hypothetical protein